MVGDCWRCLKFIASWKTLSFKWQILQWKNCQWQWSVDDWCVWGLACYGQWHMCSVNEESDQSMTDVFEVLATVNDWCVWGSCYGQWRKSVTDVLLEVKLASVLPLCPASTMRLALVLHPLKRCTRCSVNDESGRSLTKVCPPGAWSKRDRVPALF